MEWCVRGRTMADFPYVAVQSKLISFLEDIQRLGVPEKVSQNWLKTVGYTSSNDVSIPRVLELIGFDDVSRKPTDKWRNFRDRNSSEVVLSAAIKEGYEALYRILPDAHQRSDDDLKNFFRPRTEAGEQAVRRTASTFKTLCSLADFGQLQEGEAVQEGQNGTKPGAKQPGKLRDANQAPAPTIHVAVQIQISSDASLSQIDQVFESMAKHLYNKCVEEQNVSNPSQGEDVGD